MKSLLFSILTVLFAVNIGLSQTDKLIKPTYENNILTCTYDNGVEVNKKVKFNLTTETIKLVDSLKFNIDQDVITFLDNKFKISTIFIKRQLKNKNSFDYIDDSIGSIYINDKNELIMSYYFTAQNGFGNKLSSQALYKIFYVGDKIETDYYILK